MLSRVFMAAAAFSLTATAAGPAFSGSKDRVGDRFATTTVDPIRQVGKAKFSDIKVQTGMSMNKRPALRNARSSR